MTARALRAVIVASTILAAIAEAYLATWDYRPVLWIALAGFALGLAIGHRYRWIALPIVMPLLYVMPAIYHVWTGYKEFGYDAIWLLPLLGLTLSSPAPLQWSLPARWQWPLVTWAAIVSISWPIVFLRESDFTWWVAIMPLERVSNSSNGIGPWQAALNVTYFVLLHNAGIFWIDALCRWYRDQRERFRAEVLLPLAIAAVVSCVVSVYQGFVDLTFLNTGFWAYMIRAGGTLGDPNKLGTIAAFWTVGSLVLARRAGTTRAWVMAAAAMLLGVSGVWLSGSRTGLGALVFSLPIAAIEAIRAWRSSPGATRWSPARVAAVTGALLAVAVVLIVALRFSNTHTIAARGTLGYLPFFGDRGIAASVNELLWERFGYGPAAIQMIAEHPIDGVGIGVFHTVVHDFATLRGYTGDDAIVSDNAQNWFRHNLAELGIIGSIPLLWWSVLLGYLMFGGSSGSDRLSIGLLRGVIIGFGMASIFGMPAQSMAVVITFWAFVFWLLVERNGEAPGPAPAASWSRGTVVLTMALLAIHTTATVVDARGDLWPRHRSTRFGWFYKYGMSELEADPGGNPVQRRWTILPKSLAVVPVSGTVMKFVAWIDHPDGDQRPVKVKVWADGRLVFDGEIKRSAPLFMDIAATPGRTHMILETEVDRLWAPRDYGMSDRRALGLSIRDWVWQ